MEQILIDYAPYIAAVTAFVVLAEKIAKLTPTKTDDKFVGYAHKLFSVLGLNVKDNAGK